jgi:hypothetical protein
MGSKLNPNKKEKGSTDLLGRSFNNNNKENHFGKGP